MKPTLLLLILLLLSGCMTIKGGNEFTRPDGTMSKTNYLAVSSAWPMGELKQPNQDFLAQYGDGKLTMGQKSEGMDNTKQTEFLGSLVSALIQAYVKLPTASLGGDALTTPLTGLNNTLTDVNTLADRVSALSARLKQMEADWDSWSNKAKGGK